MQGKGRDGRRSTEGPLSFSLAHCYAHSTLRQTDKHTLTDSDSALRSSRWFANTHTLTQPLCVPTRPCLQTRSPACALHACQQRQASSTLPFLRKTFGQLQLNGTPCPTCILIQLSARPCPPRGANQCTYGEEEPQPSVCLLPLLSCLPSFYSFYAY